MLTDHNRQAYERLLAFFIRQAPTTLKAPSGSLRHPFIDPGSVYEGNLWDWDSFFALYALLAVSHHDETLRGEVLAHGAGNVENFFDHQLEDGYIPMMIECKEEVPYLTRKHREGAILNMHKPFLASQTLMLCRASGDYSPARKHAKDLKRYFDCYDKYYLHADTGLYVWADDVMIGMDNDPASFGRPRFSTANIYLNSFMVHELRAAEALLSAIGDADAPRFAGKADALSGAIQELCWDERDGFFYSCDVQVKTRAYDWFHVGLGVFWKALPIKIRAFSGFLPLLCGIATDAQAKRLGEHVLDTKTFAGAWGIPSLAMDERMFSQEATINPSNWLGPVWLVVQYLVFRAFLQAGRRDIAEGICGKALTLLDNDLQSTGALHEYYDVHTGQPIMNSGFLNWNMLCINMVRELDGDAPPLPWA